MSNSISLVGRLGKDAEVKSYSGGEFLTFNLANNVGFGANKKTNWFKCSYFTKAASTLAPYLKKGNPVFVTGELSLDTWTSPEGVERSSMSINLKSLDLVSGGDDVKPTSDNPPKARAEESKEDEESLPF